MREQEPNSVRNDLLNRLRESQGSGEGGIAELASKRAREGLEQALEEARAIRLQALEDSRLTRERELNALLQALRSLRQSAESQIESLLRAAEIEAERTTDQAKIEAQAIVEHATAEAAQIRGEANAIRSGAEQRQKDVALIEAEFDKALAQIAQRLGLTQKPSWDLFRKRPHR